MQVKYPHITVQLTGINANAFNIIGVVGRAMRRAGCTPAQIVEFRNEAMSGDYDNLIQTCYKYVEVH